MEYFDDEDSVQEYLAMCADYDPRPHVEKIHTHLAPGATLLEIGMGPGADLDILAETYRVTGSDRSQVFLDRYRGLHPEADLLALDAVSLATDRTFGALYSNKVLHHLTRNALVRSFARQVALLNDGGLAMHSFWHGDGEEEHCGMLFTHHTESSIREAIGDGFDMIGTERYTEMEPDDSLLIFLRRR